MKRCIDDESDTSLPSEATDLSPDIDTLDECIEEPSSEATDMDDDMFRTR